MIINALSLKWWQGLLNFHLQFPKPIFCFGVNYYNEIRPHQALFGYLAAIVHRCGDKT
jgi:hypothetical protein